MKRYCVKKLDYLGSGKWEHVYAFKSKAEAKRWIKADDVPYESEAEYRIVEEGTDYPQEMSKMKANNPQHPVHKRS